jgi:hypothetical protein
MRQTRSFVALAAAVSLVACTPDQSPVNQDLLHAGFNADNWAYNPPYVAASPSGEDQALQEKQDMQYFEQRREALQNK